MSLKRWGIRRQRVRGGRVGAASGRAPEGGGACGGVARVRGARHRGGLSADSGRRCFRGAGGDRGQRARRGFRGLRARGERGDRGRVAGCRGRARSGPLGGLQVARGRDVRGMVRGASRAGVAGRGALRAARGLRDGGGPARRQPRLLPDGGRAGARAGGEAGRWGDRVDRHQRPVGGERGGGAAQRQDALRERQRERDTPTGRRCTGTRRRSRRCWGGLGRAPRSRSCRTSSP